MPTSQPAFSWFAVARHLARQLTRDEVNERAAALAFRFFLALFPFSIFVTALSAFVAALLDVADPAAQMLQFLSQIPAGIAELVRDQIEAVIDTQQPGLLSIGILGTIWVATAGTTALIVAMNRAYRVNETRPLWKRYLLAVGLTLLASGALVASFVLLVVGEVIGRQVAGWLDLQGVYETAVYLGRWPVVVLMLVAATAFLYRTAPNVVLPWRRALPGAILFTVSWLVATYLFSLYVANFGAYNVTYGTLGAGAILLLWFYLTAYALLMGAELNAAIDEQLHSQDLETQRRQTSGDDAPPTGRCGQTG